jgi:hypothetical protein
MYRRRLSLSARARWSIVAALAVVMHTMLVRIVVMVMVAPECGIWVFLAAGDLLVRVREWIRPTACDLLSATA